MEPTDYQSEAMLDLARCPAELAEAQERIEYLEDQLKTAWNDIQRFRISLVRANRVLDADTLWEALDRQRWPTGDPVVTLSSRQMQALLAAIDDVRS